jgi:hypothetical protein
MSIPICSSYVAPVDGFRQRRGIRLRIAAFPAARHLEAARLRDSPYRALPKVGDEALQALGRPVCQYLGDAGGEPTVFCEGGWCGCQQAGDLGWIRSQRGQRIQACFGPKHVDTRSIQHALRASQRASRARKDHLCLTCEKRPTTQDNDGLVELDRFRYDTPDQIAAWVQHLPVSKTSFGAERRTRHALLERLIEDSCAEAIDSGQERLTEGLLDGIDISVEGLPCRDRHAGEIPDVPEVTSSRTRKPGGNTVFDDRGPVAGT